MMPSNSLRNWWQRPICLPTLYVYFKKWAWLGRTLTHTILDVIPFEKGSTNSFLVLSFCDTTTHVSPSLSSGPVHIVLCCWRHSSHKQTSVIHHPTQSSTVSTVHGDTDWNLSITQEIKMWCFRPLLKSDPFSVLIKGFPIQPPLYLWYSRVHVLYMCICCCVYAIACCSGVRKKVRRAFSSRSNRKSLASMR